MTSTRPPRDRKKAQIIGIATAIIVAATPGVYSAYQSARQEWKQKLSVEQQTRDHQEKDIQDVITAHDSSIELLRKSCVTHRELFPILMSMRRGYYRTRARTSRTIRHGFSSGGDSEGGTAEEVPEEPIALDKWKNKSDRSKEINAKLKRLRKGTPKLRSSEEVRNQIQQQYERKR